MKSKTSGTYQVMPKVSVEGARQMDNILYKGKEQSKFLAIKFFAFIFVSFSLI